MRKEVALHGRAMAAENGLQRVEGQIDRLRHNDPVMAVEPDIDPFSGEAADQVRRRGGESEEFSRLSLAGVGPYRAILAEIDGDGGCVPVLSAVIGEGQGVERSRRAARPGLRVMRLFI